MVATVQTVHPMKGAWLHLARLPSLFVRSSTRLPGASAVFTGHSPVPLQTCHSGGFPPHGELLRHVAACCEVHLIRPLAAKDGVGLSTTPGASSRLDARGVPDFGVTTRFLPLVNTIESHALLTVLH